MKKLVMFICLMLTFTTLCNSQTVKSITVHFRTTSDDKDWNTQVRDRIVCQGQDFATLECCSADRRGDHWNNNSDTSAPMTIVRSFTKGQLRGCSFVFGMVPVGNDKWVVIPKLDVTYSDNSVEEWTFDETTLVSKDSYIDKTFTLK